MSPDTNILFVTHQALADSPEWRAIRQAAMLDDRLSVRVVTEVEEISPSDIPIGSVEFCTEVANRQHIKMPPPLDYPEDLTQFLGRKVWQGILDEGVGCFIKPIQTKLFDAFVAPAEEKNFQKVVAENKLDLNTPCWISNVVHFAHEWRVYVLQKNILGVSQYDLGDEDAHLTEGEMNRIHSMVEVWKTSPAAYAIDVGRTWQGQLVLVEVNDGWATGYYPFGNFKPVQYAQWCAARWMELLKTKND